MAILNLDDFPSFKRKSAEELSMASLFMSQEESDIALKVEGKTIPAHKKVLIQKSKYFANLFKSGMVESRQDIIEIKDCDYPVFQEFLRWIYCGEVKRERELALKLLPLADKYVQNDLVHKCMNILLHAINEENIYSIFDYAFEGDIPDLKGWCQKFIRKNTNMTNVLRLIEYLNQKPKTSDLNEVIDAVVTVVRENYFAICQQEEGNKQILNSFLIRNTDIHTISKLADLVSSDSCYKKLAEEHLNNDKNDNDDDNGDNEDDGDDVDDYDDGNYSSEDEDEADVDNEKLANILEEFKAEFEKNIVNLKEAVFKFVQANFAEIKEKNIEKGFSNEFWTGFVSYDLENPLKKNLAIKEENDQIRQDNKKNERRKEKMGKEPLHQEEGSKTKKEKKSFIRKIASGFFCK